MKQVKLLQGAAGRNDVVKKQHRILLFGFSVGCPIGLKLFKSCNVDPLYPLYTLTYFVTTAGRCSLDDLATVCKYSAIYPKRGSSNGCI